MTSLTPNLSLTLYDSTTDQSVLFSEYREVISGTATTSNFYKIDTLFGIIKVDTSTSRVGIGTSGLPTRKFEVRESVALGAVSGNSKQITSVGGSTSSNSIYNDLFLLRDSNGSDWTTSRFHDSISVDATYVTPGTDTKVWWERDPYNNIQSWGNANSTYMTLIAGKLGIGNSNPTYQLEIKTSSSTTLELSGATSQLKMLAFSTDNSLRWLFRCSQDAESGANAGSNFEIVARSDAGALIGNILTGTRATLDILFGGNLSLTDAKNVAVGTTTGTKIATATTQKLGFWNATPIVQPTTSVAASTFTANSGTAINDASTFDGYTVKQVVKALRNSGLLA